MRKIVITGFAPDSRKGSPIWGRLSRRPYEVWAFNNDLEQLGIAHRWFEMHDLAVYAEKAVDDVSQSPKYLRRLREGLGVPVYMLKAHEDIPGSVAYPIDEITASFGTYFTNSISYMLALAIHERVDEVHVYGIDMAREHEHGWERPSIEFLLGWARGVGIRVVIPDTSDLLKCLGLYGYVETYEQEAVLREEREKMLATVRSLERQADMLRGAADDVDYWIRRGFLPGDQVHSAKTRSRKDWLMWRARDYERAARSWSGPARDRR